MISLGAVDFNEVEGGQDGLNYYTNLAVGKWGLLMDDFMYSGIDMTGDHFAKIALIDSGNFSIQIPATMFDNVMKEMKKHEISTFKQTVGGHSIMVARKPCSELYDKFGDIEFSLQGTIMMIKPRGYLYHQPLQNSDCFIGLESIPDDANQYRLGRVFLRNFYTGLDYDQNLIMIGPNAYSSQGAKANIMGRVGNPNRRGGVRGTFKWGWVIVIILGLIAGGVFMYIRNAKKLREEGEPKLSFNHGADQTIAERMDNLAERLDSNGIEESFDEDNKQETLAIN